MDFGTYRAAYRGAGSKGECNVLVETSKNDLGLYNATYVMGPLKYRCMVKKHNPSKPINFQTFGCLKKFRHPNVVRIENFYAESSQGRFVLSWVDQSLKDWLESVKGGKKRVKAFEVGTRPIKPSTTFRNMAIDMSKAVESLLENKICPQSVALNDFYVINVNGRPVVQFLICEANATNADSAVALSQQRDIWAKLRVTLEECCNIAAPWPIHPDSTKFFEYIGKSTTSNLQNYPDTWTDDEKISYLISLMAANPVNVLKCLVTICFGWPGGTGPLKRRIQDLKNHFEETRPGKVYLVNNPRDYLWLCRNVVKHWKSLPSELRDGSSECSGFLRKMEMWSPRIWCILYEAFGRLAC